MTSPASRAKAPTRGSTAEAKGGPPVAGASDAVGHEVERQRLLLRALRREPQAVADLPAWMSPHLPVAQGLATYHGNALAMAERALGSAYPTVAALIGGDAFAALARDLWHADPPQRGDLGEWGSALPAFMGDLRALDGVPYLQDCARLDWAVHVAARAADADRQPALLERMAAADPSTSRWCLSPGSTMVHSEWPVASLWTAHRSNAADRFEAVRVALRDHRGEAALIVREGLAVRVHALEPADAAFTQALLDGWVVAEALDRAEDPRPGAFVLDAWLARAWAAQWIVAVDESSQGG